jgi:hypothetical protein
MSGWGKPKYGSSTSSKTAKIKEGDNIYRFLPPMHSFAEEGKWSNYVAIHFGYSGVDSQDATKTRFRVFRCIQVKDFRSGMILEDCPECDLIEKNKKALEEREAELIVQFKAEGKDEKEIEELLESALGPDKGWLQSHNVDRKHYINAMTPDGREFVQVPISHRTKKQLDAVFKELQESEGIDPLDIGQGVLINIKRSGKFRDAQDVVSVVKEKVDAEVNGKKVKLEQIKLRPLTPEEAERALKECRDLATVGGLELTREQIKELTECSGDPEEVDAIIKKGQKEASPARKPAANDNSKPKAEPKSTATKAKAETKPEADKEEPVNDNAAKEAAIQKRLADIKAKKDAEAKAKAEAEAKAKKEAEAKEAPAAEEDNALLMDDEAFLAKFGG